MRMRTRNRQGAYVIILSVALVVLLGFAALAIDISYLNLVQVQAQNAADAGAHAAMIDLRESGNTGNATNAGISVVNTNLLAGEIADASSGDFVYGGWDFSDRTFTAGASYTNAVQVDVRKAKDSPNGQLELSLVRVFGELQSEDDSLGDAQTAGTAVGALRNRDIMVVLDVTLSFTEEIADAQTALLTLLDYIGTSAFPNDRIGLVVFTAEASVYSPLRFVKDSYDTIRSEWEQIYLCSAEFMGVDCFADPYNRGAGTDQARALDTAVEALVAARPSNEEALQMIVLVSDGVPYCQGTCDFAGCFGAIRTEALSIAEAAQDQDRISLYSVSFYDPAGTSVDVASSCSDFVTANDEQALFMESLVQGYGKFYDTSDSAMLADMLDSIAKSVPVALVE